MTMSELTGGLRHLIEEQVDAFLKDPDAFSNLKNTLINMDIQPGLETTLSYITGIITGTAIGMWMVIRKKEGKPKVTDQESDAFLKEVDELLTRRATELRQHFEKEEYM